MTATDALTHSARREISGFAGRFTSPEDQGYEEARAVYNAMIDRRPALIATAADAEDVARVVDFAAKKDVLLAVRGGAHNGAGLGTVDDLRRYRRPRARPRGRKRAGDRGVPHRGR